MNKFIISALAAGALAVTLPVALLPAMAQKAPEKAVEKAVEKAADKAAATPGAAIPKGTFYRGLGPTQYLAKTRLIGQSVLDKNGAKVGDIEDIILGTKDNQIDGVIMGVGGFLGVGEKKIGVRIAALKFDSKDGKTVISMPLATKELLASIDTYEGSRTMLQKAGDAVKDAAKKAGDAAKNLTTKKEEAPAKK